MGVLPGLGPALFITILIPFLLSIGNDITMLIFMAAIFYGSQYGSSTSAILLNIPGEPSSVPTAIAGNKLYKEGRSYDALITAAISSFIAGILSVVIIFCLSPILVGLSFVFKPTDYFWCFLFTVIIAIVATGKNILLNVLFSCIAFILGTIGLDAQTFYPRNTFGLEFLENGIKVLFVVAALFGINEIISNFKDENYKIYDNIKKTSFWKLLIDKKIWLPSLKGTAIGSIMGILPGVGTVIASNISYVLENKDKTKKKDLELIAAPESANNAASQTGFIPLMVLGIPTTFMMVIIYSVLLMISSNSSFSFSQNNLEPLYIISVSMIIGNVLLLILNTNLSSFWIKILSIPRFYIFIVVLFLLCFGIFSINKNVEIFFLLLFLSIFGLVLKNIGGDLIPFLTTFVLAPRIDSYFQRSLIINENNFLSFFTSSVSIGIIVFGILFSFWIYRITSKA